MPLPEARPRVFISYARSDGEAHARALRDRLEAEQVPLWRDREGMEGGRDWWQQITAAIDSVDFLVLVITAAALQSTMVRREWRYARQRGVSVYPVLVDAAVDFATLPRWMRSVHFYDLQHEWRKFVNDLHTRPTPVRVPFMVEDLPAGFVPRPREYALLAAQLLDPERGEPIAITAALRGAGGFGKTALTRALCHDERIQDAFDDGVLWVTLGERPGDLRARVEDLIAMLSGQRPGYAGLEAAVAALAELLADRDMLIVIDDVWDAAHAHPFLQGGERCARIITTRLSDVLPLGVRRVEVDAMATDEAVSLLAQGLPDTAGVDLVALARRLGEWPLLLKLVNGALRERVLQRRQSLPAALDYVNLALDKRGLTFFDARDAAARHAAVGTTLGVSLAQLSAAELQRLDDLAVFPEDVDIPLATLAAWWSRSAGLDAFDVEGLCERLERLSLLLAFDPTARFVRLHDVVRRFLIERLGTRLPGLHDSLLDALRPAGGRWAALAADEPYAWPWLFFHLQAAGRVDELRRTALDLRYLAAKSVARGAFSVEADLHKAQALCPDEPVLPPLSRRFRQTAHLFAQCGDVAEAHATLRSRLQHVDAHATVRSRLQQLPVAAGLVAAADVAEPFLAPSAMLPDLPHPALVRTLAIHRGAVRACAITPDGRLAATAAVARHVTLWDARSGQALRTLVPDDPRQFSGQGVRALCFSSDGNLLAAAAGDRRIWLWDTATGALLAQCQGHTDAVTDCALSADGRMLVSGSLDGSLKLWDVASGALRRTLAREWANNDQGWLVAVNDQGHWSGVLGCAISRDGTRVASGSSDQTVIVWDTADGRALQVLKGHTQGVNACAFSPDGQALVSAGSDGTLRIWNLASGECRALAAHPRGVQACTYTADGERIVSASADGTLRIWSSDGDELLHTLSGHTDWVYDCDVASAAGLLVSASNDGTARLWDLQPPPEPYRLRQHEGLVRACALLPQRNLLLTGGQDRQLMQWDVRSGQARRSWLAHDGPVRGCAASPDGQLLASASVDGQVVVWDAATATQVSTLVGHRDWVNACAFHPQAPLIASVSNDRTLRLWDLRTRSRKLALVAHAQWVNHCAFSPDGRHVVTAAADGTLTRWSMAFDEALWEAWLADRRPLAAERARAALSALDFVGHEASVNHCAHAPGSDWLVTASSDRTLKVWDSASGRLLRTLRGHLGDVEGCDVSADGRRIVSVSAEGGLKVWDSADGRCLMSIQVDGGLSSCAWTAGQERLAAVGARGVYFFACQQGLSVTGTGGG